MYVRTRPFHILGIAVFIPFLIFIRAGNVKPREEIYTPNYAVYHNLSRIQHHLVDIAKEHRKYITIDWTYHSREDRPQMLVKIANFTEDSSRKVRIFFSYGEHAREFFPVESMFHLIKNISDGIKSPGGSPAAHFTRTVLSKVELFIVAIANPDGRKYVETSGNYCWRGTSTGVDINRNFDWNYGGPGSSGNQNDEEYRGSHPFSEQECVVLNEVTRDYKFDAFFSFHSGIREIYIPFADSMSKSRKRLPGNLEEMIYLGDILAKSARRTFKADVAYKLNEYTADGTVFDYMAGVKKIPFSYAIELYGEGDHNGAKCFDLFNPPSNALQNELEAIHPMYAAIFKYLVDWKQKQGNIHKDNAEETPSLALAIFLLVIVITLTLLMALRRFPFSSFQFFRHRRIVSMRSLSSTLPH